MRDFTQEFVLQPDFINLEATRVEATLHHHLQSAGFRKDIKSLHQSKRSKGWKGGSWIKAENRKL
jgi:hypothetical protein